ncbi:MAG TPA: response regulator [Elusimicrobiota bacterium]|nr:response regulator [Elusimicrobiota bacterium]
MIAQILIGEDSPDIAMLLQEFLAARKHLVVVATDGFDLRQKASEHRPHLIITDVQMPGAYGSSVYQSLQNDPKTASIPVIFISAHPYDKIKTIIPEGPKTRFVQKPIDFKKLDLMIQELLPLGGFAP